MHSSTHLLEGSLQDAIRRNASKQHLGWIKLHCASCPDKYPLKFLELLGQHDFGDLGISGKGHSKKIVAVTSLQNLPENIGLRKPQLKAHARPKPAAVHAAGL